MKYIDNREIDNIEPNTVLYACAYDEDNNYEYTHLGQKPVKGIVVKNEGKYQCKLWSHKIFLKLGKNGEPLKSGAVSLRARKYATTYEECVEIYNSLVDERINKLKQFIDIAESDKIRC